MRKPILFLAAMILLVSAAAAFSADLEALVKERSVTLYPEGQLLGDLVIGARGKILFVYVDKALAHAVRGTEMPPEWLSWHTRYWGTDQAKGKALVLIRYEANKPWTFHPVDISIGGRHLERSDILTDKAFIAEGDLPSGAEGILSVAVPLENAAPGKTTTLAYLEDSTEWIVPAK